MSGVEFGHILGACVGLAGLGLVYALIIGYVNEHGYGEGFIWLEVVGGTLVVLAALAFFDLAAAALALAFFATFGLPMSLSSIGRYVGKRQAAIQRLRDEAKHGHTS